MKKQFLIIFAAILLMVLITSSCSLMLSIQSQTMSRSDDLPGEPEKTEKPGEENEASKESDEAKANESEAPPASYSFVGRVHGLSSEPDTEQEQDDLEVADSDELDGYVPELTIETNGVNMEAVAEHYGFVLALMTDDRLLGRIENGNLESINKDFLSHFADRAREGYISAEIRPLVDRISNHLNKRVQAVYLVPNQVEQEFIRIQMEAIEQQGRSPQEVQLVRARYRRDYSIEVLEVI